MTKERSSKIVYFMILGARVLVLGHGHTSHLMKIHYFFLKCSFILRITSMNQTNLSYSKDDQGKVYQTSKFHDPRGKVSCARAWSYKSDMQYHLLYRYAGHYFLLYYRIIMLLYSAIVNFYLFYEGAVHVQV